MITGLLAFLAIILIILILFEYDFSSRSKIFINDELEYIIVSRGWMKDRETGHWVNAISYKSNESFCKVGFDSEIYTMEEKEFYSKFVPLSIHKSRIKDETKSKS